MALHSISGNATVVYENGVIPNIDNDLGTIRGVGNVGATTLWADRPIRESGTNRKFNPVVSGVGGAQEINNQGVFGGIGQVIQSVNTTLAGISNTTFRSPASNAANRSDSIHQLLSSRVLNNKTAVRSNAWDEVNASWDTGFPQNVQSGIYDQNLNLNVSTLTGIRTNAGLAITGVHVPVFDDGTLQSITTNNVSFAHQALITAQVTGVAANVGAISVLVSGTDFQGTVQTETLPAFTVNVTGTVTGVLRFDSVTSWRLPAHDAGSVSTSIGYADRFSTGTAMRTVDNAANPTRAIPGEYIFLIGGSSNFVSGDYSVKNT